MVESLLRHVELIKADPKNRTTLKSQADLCITDDSNSFLGSGAETRAVKRVGVRSNSGLIVQMAFKEIAPEGLAAKEFKTGVHLKKAGVPVPTTYRLVEENGKYVGVVMTDLTNNWKNIYITSNSKVHVLRKVEKLNPALIKALWDFDIYDEGNKAQLDAEAVNVASRATNAQINLENPDTISAVFTPERGFRLVVADMGSITLDDPQDPVDLYERNYFVASFIRRHIEEAQRLTKYL